MEDWKEARERIDREFEPPEPLRTIVIVCQFCGRHFKKTLTESEIEQDYIFLLKGTYEGKNADHWCDECERADQRQITRDWNQ